MAKPYIRRPTVAVKTLTLDRRAADLLEHLAPTGRGFGAYISHLIFCEQARIEERARLLQGIPMVHAGEVPRG